MPNRNYQAGRRFEWNRRDDLLSRGFSCVARTAGSKSKIDLFAIGPGAVLFVQCKDNGKIAPLEREVLFTLAQHNPAVTHPVLATKEGYFLLTGVGPKDRVPVEPEDLVDD